MIQYKKDLLAPWWNKVKSETKYLRWPKRQLKKLVKEIDERKLDIKVAEKVFGHKVEILEFTEYLDYGGQVEWPELGIRIHHAGYCPGEVNEPWFEDIMLPHYSTHIEDAWKCLTADKIPLDSVHLYFPHQYNTAFTVRLEHDNFPTSGDSKCSISEAICLAALKAVEHVRE